MNDHLLDVYRSSIKFLEHMTLEATYETFCTEAMKLVDADVATILLMRRGGLQRAYSTSEILSNIKLRRRGYTYSVYKTKKPIILDADKMDVHPLLKEAGIKSDILVPLIYKGRAVGVLSVQSKKKKFTKEDANLLLLMSASATLAIRKAQLNNELNQAIKSRDFFISMASHELRTPITTIYTYLQIINKNYVKNKKIDPQWIDNLLQEMTRLTKLTDELLQINQIRTGDLKYDFEEVNLVDIAKISASSFITSHKKHSLIFENNTESEKISVIGDSNKLIQVIINLLDNSRKHSPYDKPIALKLSANRKFAFISVADQGTGIKKNELKKVFDEFYKAEGNTKAGMGIGLFLIKRVIEKHRGKIQLKSKEGVGTLAKISLPLAQYMHP